VRTPSSKRLHIDIRGGGQPRVAHHPLDVFDVAFVLGQRRNRAANDLEGQLRQFQLLRQLVQHPFAVVARIDEPAVASRKNEPFGFIRGRSMPTLLVLLFFLALLAPCLEFFCQLLGNRDLGETSLGLSPRTDLPLVGGLLDLDQASSGSKQLHFNPNNSPGRRAFDISSVSKIRSRRGSRDKAARS
jgi:hypothetical protein